MTIDEFLSEWRGPSPRILVHTSGSTGKPKSMWVEKRRMEASALTTCRFLGLRPGDTALLCMSLDYIAGKMMAVRAEVCGLRLVSVAPSSHPLATLAEAPAFAAMVPMQVHESLKVARERELLGQIRHLIIGGGAIDDTLASSLQGLGGEVWSTYGMTETLSHIAMRRVNGAEASEWYEPMDGVGVSVSESGCLVVNAPTVCDAPVVTNDRAVMAADGRRFRIIGRVDNVICSGGIKIQAEEVEQALRPHLAFPFAITKVADETFGEAVALLGEGKADVEAVRAVCQRVLPRYWVPRHYVFAPRLPLTDTGKPARKLIQQLAERLLGGAVE